MASGSRYSLSAIRYRMQKLYDRRSYADIGAIPLITPLPYLEEFNIKNKENAIVLNFDLSNLDEVVEQIKEVAEHPRKINYKLPNDRYDEILVKSKSTYNERRKGMKRIRVKQKFLDMKHNNLLRRAGEEFLETAERADDLIERGFAVLIEDIQEKKTEVETAVAEVNKEVAVEKKEKATPKKAEAKKNAKK